MSWKQSDISEKDMHKIFSVLQERFASNLSRHQGLVWDKIEKKLREDLKKVSSLHAMERTGGEPDVIGYDKKNDSYIFCDCSAESPKWRRSLCYDEVALKSRKEHKPKDSAVNMAKQMWIELLDEEQYRNLQKLWAFDTKTSSWVKTPEPIRKLGWAIFCDHRYDHVFTYHNGAESYYAARGFRGSLRV